MIFLNSLFTPKRKVMLYQQVWLILLFLYGQFENKGDIIHDHNVDNSNRVEIGSLRFTIVFERRPARWSRREPAQSRAAPVTGLRARRGLYFPTRSRTICHATTTTLIWNHLITLSYLTQFIILLLCTRSSFKHLSFITITFNLSIYYTVQVSL